ncbi:MAG TPA: hypothetical protein PLU80_09895 [Acidobacteriota bacterium]|nr:hypothetical protein [Acidobacteriota bacterium]
MLHKRQVVPASVSVWPRLRSVLCLLGVLAVLIGDGIVGSTRESFLGESLIASAHPVTHNRFLQEKSALTGSPTPEEQVSETLRASRHVLKLENGKLTGPGADLLIRDARDSQFVFLGEEHFIAEVPRFAQALWSELTPAGFEHLVIEVGPYTTPVLEAIVKKPGYADQLKAIEARSGLAIPFYTLREEADFVAAVVQSSKSKIPVLWGLDQENAFAVPDLLERVAALANDEPAKQVAKRVLSEAQTANTKAITERNPGLLAMMQMKPETFGELRTALASKSNAPALALVNGIEASKAIYDLYFQGKGYESNLRREQYLKTNFIQAFREAQRQTGHSPKAMLKFGFNHAYRGRNAVEVHGIGNFIAEKAAAEGKSSLHVMVIGGANTKNAAFDISQMAYGLGNNETMAATWFQPIASVIDADQWTLVDLRPLRPILASGKIKGLHRNLEKVIWGFDLVVVLSKSQPATPLRKS